MTLLHIVGSAHGAVEVALICGGLALNFLALGVAVMALWPAARAGRTVRSASRTARRRALRRAEELGLAELAAATHDHSGQ